MLPPLNPSIIVNGEEKKASHAVLVCRSPYRSGLNLKPANQE